MDTSGSMAGDKLIQSRQALKYCVEQLDEKDRFSVVRFSTGLDTLFHELRGLLEERIDHLVLRNDADALALDEQVTFAPARGDPDVGLTRFPGAIDDATHHGDLNRQGGRLERCLRLRGNGDDVDVGTAARGTGDEI